MKTHSILLLFFVTILFGSCHNTTNQVVVYTSVDQIFSEPILQDFEKEFHIKVKAVYDTEETKSTGVLNRLLAEKDNPQCDVFWSGDPIRPIVLKNKGIGFPFHSKNAKSIASVFKDKAGYWTGFSARARVLIYNKKMLDTAAIPHSIFDLTKEMYKGKVAIANPLFGTTTFHIAALFENLGTQKAKAFLKKLKQNEVLIATSNGDVKKRVLKGEMACGLTDTDDAFEALKESEDVGYIFLDQQGIGSLLMPNTVSLIRENNKINALLLLEYLLSQKTEQKLAISCGQMPLHKGVPTPKGVPSLDHILPMKIDYEKTAQKLEEIQAYLKKWAEN